MNDNTELMRNLDALDTDALKAELIATLSLTAQTLVRAACIVAILEKRGEPLSDLRCGLIWYLRRIASGSLLADVVARFAGTHSLERIAVLPVIDQQKCLSEDGMEVGTLGVDGDVEVRMRKIDEMERWEARQVFGRTHIRTPVEQVAWRRAQDAKPNDGDITPPLPAPYTVKHGRLVVIRPVTICKRDLQRIIASLG